jgi:hypothetical protein
VADAPLSVRVGDVALDGGQADHQPVGDLLISRAGRDQEHDLDFPGRERLDEAGAGPCRRGGAWEPAGAPARPRRRHLGA